MQPKLTPKLTDIIEYYDSCEEDYRRFWNLDDSLAMHAGFWDEYTTTLADALARENEVLAEFVEIQRGERVLDAGCGIGGSSLFLARHYTCSVVGITLSPLQVKEATLHAKKQELENLVQFQTMDFCHTTFPDTSFDVVWAVESACHATHKEEFVKEAYRLLKKGGRLIVADGFKLKDHYSTGESFAMSTWLQGWGVQSLDTKETFYNHLISTGFSSVKYQNMTSQVMPSSKRLYLISFPAFILSKVGEWFGKRKKIQTNNIRAAYYQHKTLKKNLWEYGIFCAYKT
jgi:tocopherol O-methyltransferase